MAWLYQYWSLSININIIKRTKAYCYIRDQNFVHVDMPADLQMLLLDVPFDSAHATTGLSHYEATSCNNFILFKNIRLNNTQYLEIRQNRSTWLPTCNTLRGLG